jgi:hypothetical protein
MTTTGNSAPEEQLNGADIGTGFQQMNREGMSQRMRRDRLPSPKTRCAFLQASSTASFVIDRPA